MDADMWQTRLLQSENDKMLAELYISRNKDGLEEDC
jgi:hypothetical protein